MRKRIILLVISSLFIGASYAQDSSSGKTEFNHWSIDAGIGLTKPYRNVARGYSTATPDFLAGELGARYMFNEFFGLKAGFVYNNFQAEKSTLDFTTKQYEFDLQGVIGIGRLLRFETWTQTLNLLAHGGFGVGLLDFDLLDDNDHFATALAGLTGQIKLSPRVALNIDGTMGFHVHQNRTWDGTMPRNNEPFVFNGTIGFSYYLGKKAQHADWVVRENEYLALMDERIADLEAQIKKSREEDARKVQEADDQLGRRIDDLDGQVAMLANAGDDDIVGRLINEGYVNIFFDFNSSKIDKGAADAINLLRNYMMKNANVAVNLIGYADEKGTEEYNKKLSTKRAEAVAELLVKSGIDKSRLHTEGKGEDTSVDESSPNARQLARRVTFSIR
ncbi:OmpA family protein [uncultured Sunxiuqinia sp.]|uniref:OmpA family protein n=1 Tax=uncultured Sunxiuqinia sp. TaxID=1573825 RepID=UPI002608B0DC|nr:OmpA family protein [uncultured Sunxiuqinia sp.]